MANIEEEDEIETLLNLVEPLDIGVQIARKEVLLRNVLRSIEDYLRCTTEKECMSCPEMAGFRGVLEEWMQHPNLSTRMAAKAANRNFKPQPGLSKKHRPSGVFLF